MVGGGRFVDWLVGVSYYLEIVWMNIMLGIFFFSIIVLCVWGLEIGCDF